MHRAIVAGPRFKPEQCGLEGLPRTVRPRASLEPSAIVGKTGGPCGGRGTENVAGLKGRCGRVHHQPALV